MTVAETVDRYLRIYDQSDPIYKSLISNVDGIPAGTVNNFTDFNIGIFAGMLEWNRNLALYLITQLFMDQAEGRFLDEIIDKHIGIKRYDSESDIDYVTRVQDFILAPKISPASIIAATIPFSSPGTPQILEGKQDSAFADLSFADVYTPFENTAAGPEFDFHVFPALSADESAVAYFFILILENTAGADISKVFDITDRWIASGIDYEVQIKTV